MSTIYVFPGQGAQFVGMGAELYKNNAAARAVFDEVDEALGEKLSNIIFNGSMEELTLTKNVQPAIMATSVAMFRASGLPLPEYVAGHSLGEYTALCVAGAISLANAARLLRARGNAMQKSVPVGMGLTSVVLGLDADTVRAVCEQSDCDLANDNCPGQVVISGLKEPIEMASERLKELGARRVMPLNLSAPVHCRVQEPSVEIMRGEFEKVKIDTPRSKWISNKTCAFIENPNEIKEALIYQLTHGVRWRESVLEMVNLGIDKAIEIGPGNVLSGLINRTTDKIITEKLEI
ncbi:MAG: ACP S-malonyltransferase [Alphaproteobacteria bacterium]|nr:ACP S-malonyltransferase [Alphaproteobacteria bacterium]